MIFLRANLKNSENKKIRINNFFENDKPTLDRSKVTDRTDNVKAMDYPLISCGSKERIHGLPCRPKGIKIVKEY